MSDLLALAERVEALEGPCRETDADVAEALGHKITWLPSGDIRNANGGPVIHWQAPHPYKGMREPCPLWTGSLDAATTLVPQGWDWVLASHGSAVLRRGEQRVESEAGASPANTLTAAALRARAAGDAVRAAAGMENDNG